MKSNICFKEHNLDIWNSTKDIVWQFNLLQYDIYGTLMYSRCRRCNLFSSSSAFVQCINDSFVFWKQIDLEIIFLRFEKTRMDGFFYIVMKRFLFSINTILPKVRETDVKQCFKNCILNVKTSVFMYVEIQFQIFCVFKTLYVPWNSRLYYYLWLLFILYVKYIRKNKWSQ